MYRKKGLKKVFTCFLLITMLVVLFVPGTVLAEGEEPPTEESPAVEEEGVSLVEVEMEYAEEAPEGEATPEEDLSEAVEVLTETETVILDEEGEVVPLASQEAAEILTAPDPVFCQQNGDCGESRTNMADAIADALASGEDGTIFVEAGTFTGFELTSFGESGSPINITIHGGIGGTTYFDSQIFIHNNYANIILRDFTVNISGSDAGYGINGTPVSSGADTPTILSLDNTGTLTLYNITTTNTYDTALYIGTTSANIDGHTSGDVSLVNVEADGGANTSVEYGAFIDNTAGSGNIVIDDSDFHAGGNDALKVKSNGEIKISDTTASNSGGTGISIESHSPGAPNVVTLRNVIANNNSGRGIYLMATDGDFVLADVIANANGSDGAYLSTASTSGYSSLNAVIRSNFIGNAGAGLYLRHDASHLTSMTLVNAVENGYYGLVAHPSSSLSDSYTFATCWVNLLDNSPKNLFINGASSANPMKWYYYNLQHQNKYDYNPGNNWTHPHPPDYQTWCENCDYDADGVPDRHDLCPSEAGPVENNGCPLLTCPEGTEPDGFGGCIDVDICSGYDHNVDSDTDGIPDGCDTCPLDPENDIDDDGICGDVDNCRYTYNPRQRDNDGDGLGNECDPLPDGPPPEEFEPGIIPVTGGQLVQLPCSTECVTLQLPDGTEAEFCGLCGYWVSLSEEIEETIPWDMPEGAEMLLGMTVVLMDPDQNLLDAVPPGATLKLGYPLPAGVAVEDLHLHLYDPVAEAWVELTGAEVLAYFEAYAEWPGTCILVN